MIVMDWERDGGEQWSMDGGSWCPSLSAKFLVLSNAVLVGYANMPQSRTHLEQTRPVFFWLQAIPLVLDEHFFAVQF